MTASLSLPPLPPRLPPPEIEPDLLEVESLKVVARLRRHGHVAYLVGGCVRDLLCSATPKDYDVATSARPEEIRAVFRNSRLIGRRFRLAHVFFPNGKIIEVATFRADPLAPEVPEPTDVDADVDGEEDDGADEVADDTPDEPVDLLVTDDNQFGTVEEDARRRDFTVNGLFYDIHEGTVLDYVGGREDLARKVIRTIGSPEIRMREDPVRGLRAARIAAKLGFTVEPETFLAMQRHADELPRCAAARVLEETLKVLRSGASRPAFEILRGAHILRVLLPPVEEQLARGGDASAAALWRRLDALDALVKRGDSVTDAVMLATVLSFLPEHTPPGAHEGAGFDEEPDDEPHVIPSIDKVLSQMSAHARLPRRIADRVRAIISSQHQFEEQPKKKRRRRGGGGFVRAPHFPEALQLFEIHQQSVGKGLAAVETWRRKAEEAAAPKPAREQPAREQPAPQVVEAKPAPEATAAPTEGAPAKKKRRRRGGRGRKKDTAQVEGAEAAPSTDGDEQSDGDEQTEE